jgi:hypothetical protein
VAVTEETKGVVKLGESPSRLYAVPPVVTERGTPMTWFPAPKELAQEVPETKDWVSALVMGVEAARVGAGENANQAPVELTLLFTVIVPIVTEVPTPFKSWNLNPIVLKVAVFKAATLLQVITGSLMPWTIVQVGAVPEKADKSVDREPVKMMALAPAEVSVAIT